MFLIKGHSFPPFSSGLSFIERERGPGRRPKAKQSEPKRRHNRRSGQTSPLILFPSASEQEKATGASSYPMNPTPGTSEGSSRTSAAHGRAQSAGADRWPGDLLSFREMGRTWAERLVDDFFFFFSSSSLSSSSSSGWSFRMDGRQNCSTARQRPDSWHERRHYLSKVFTQHSCRFSSLRALKGIPINVRIKSK